MSRLIPVSSCCNATTGELSVSHPFSLSSIFLREPPIAMTLTCKPFCVWGDKEFWKIECSSYPIKFRCGMSVWYWKQMTLVGSAIFSITESITRCDGCKSKNLSCFNSNWISDITLVGTAIFSITKSITRWKVIKLSSASQNASLVIEGTSQF